MANAIVPKGPAMIAGRLATTFGPGRHSRVLALTDR
jgi:hypothetical protein